MEEQKTHDLLITLKMMTSPPPHQPIVLTGREMLG